MRVSTWNDGSHSKSGSGYGVKIAKRDRDEFFDKS